jgi:hypothetical protein
MPTARRMDAMLEMKVGIALGALCLASAARP